MDAVSSTGAEGHLEEDLGEGSDWAVAVLDLAHGTLESHSDAKAPDAFQTVEPMPPRRTV